MCRPEEGPTLFSSYHPVFRVIFAAFTSLFHGIPTMETTGGLGSVVSSIVPFNQS